MAVIEARDDLMTSPLTRRDPDMSDESAACGLSTRSAGLPWKTRFRRRRLQMGEHGWTYERLAEEMRTVAVRHGLGQLPDSLPNMICRWAAGRNTPSHLYRHLLAEAMGTHVTDLGLPVDPDYPPWTYGGNATRNGD